MIGYIGGKSFLAKWIISHFPSDYTQMSYCEVFGGGGWILYRKEESPIEIYNDLNKDLVNLFRTIRDNYSEFSHRAEWTLHSREMYQEAKRKLADDDFLNEVERALCFAVRQGQSFAGTGTTWGYSLSAEKMYSGKWLPFVRRLEYINAALKKFRSNALILKR